MTIIGDTTITHTDYRNDNHFLSLASYKEIGTEKLKTYFLIDILGQVVDLGNIISVQVKGEERKRVQFRLRDTRLLGKETTMARVTNSEIIMLNNLKPYKTTWKVEVKVLHSWTQHSNYFREDTFELILEAKM
ncbi:unnamed protein product, partial [Eruca vesicaria subsp. sativa]|nr:unnamed protein product [Eruca vesicaria subsp. sativa]